MTALPEIHGPSDARAGSTRLNAASHVLYPAVLALAIYAVTLGGVYAYDDMRLLVEDPRLRDPSQWSRYAYESYNGGVDNLYRPLTSISYAIQWWLHGDRPWAFHLVNILLHAAATACVAELARRLLGGNRTAALIAGLLFAVHPIHTEAVANIAGRPELICSLGMFGALVLAMKSMTVLRAFVITACTIVAILGKEQGMLVPIMVMVLFMAKRQPGLHDSSPQGTWILGVLLGATLLGYLLWREWNLTFGWDRAALDWTVNPLIPSPANVLGGSVGRNAWLMPVVLLGRYTALLVAPIHLSPDYGGQVIGCNARFDDPYLYLGFSAILVLGVILAISIQRRNLAGIFLTIALALSYAMVGNIVTYIGTIFGERLMYAPSAFVLILIAAPLSRLRPTALRIVMTLLLLAGTWRTVSYARLWSHPTQLYKVTAAQKPQSVKLKILLAHQYLLNKDFEHAERTAAEARNILPEYADVWVRSAIIAMEQRKWDEANQFLAQGVRVDSSGYVQAWLAELARRRTLDAATTRP